MAVPNLNATLSSRVEAEREAGYLLSEAVMLAMEDLEVNAGNTNESLHKGIQVLMQATLLMMQESSRQSVSFRLYIKRLTELLPYEEREEMLSD